jgi:hypothetical protein
MFPVFPNYRFIEDHLLDALTIITKLRGHQDYMRRTLSYEDNFVSIETFYRTYESKLPFYFRIYIKQPSELRHSAQEKIFGMMRSSTSDNMTLVGEYELKDEKTADYIYHRTGLWQEYVATTATEIIEQQEKFWALHRKPVDDSKLFTQE